MGGDPHLGGIDGLRPALEVVQNLALMLLLK